MNFLDVLMLAKDEFIEMLFAPGIAKEFGIMIATTMMLGYFLRYKASFFRNWLAVGSVLVVFLLRVVNTFLQTDSHMETHLWIIAITHMLIFVASLLLGGLISRLSRQSVTKPYKKKCVTLLEAISNG